MKKQINDLAYFGGTPVFSAPLHVAQINIPPWETVKDSFKAIFKRKYYANHGPLVNELDKRFAEFIGCQHAVSVTNGTVALMVLAKGLALAGEVIVPAFTFPATVQALSWAGLKPVLCDVDAETHMLTPATISRHITPKTCGILGVHIWGRPCMPELLQSFADTNGYILFYDACHGIGCASNGKKIGNFGSGEAFSFHATKILNGGEGGCITTNDPELADRLRTIRNFHPSETYARVPLRLNGKMSEAQAALALLSLEEYSQNVAANKIRYDALKQEIEDIQGIRLVSYDPENSNNYQYLVLEVDEQKAGLSRDILLTLLSAENIFCRRHFYPGVHKMTPYSNQNAEFPVTDMLCKQLLQLPNSQNMTAETIQRIALLIRMILSFSNDITKRVDTDA